MGENVGFKEEERCKWVSMKLGLEMRFLHGLQTHLNRKRVLTGRRERMLEMISLGKMQLDVGSGGLLFVFLEFPFPFPFLFPFPLPLAAIFATKVKTKGTCEMTKHNFGDADSFSFDSWREKSWPIKNWEKG